MLLVAALVVAGLAFQQLLTLLIAVLATVLVAILLDSAASPLERRGVPRPLGALIGLLAGVAVFGAMLFLIIPPFVDQTDEFVGNVPAVVDDLQERVHDLTGASRSEIGHRAQDFAREYTDNPEKLLAPLASIGIGVAGFLAALILMLIIAYYMAAHPKPLITGMLRMFPPDRREHAQFVMTRLRDAWVGWMQGVAVDMILTGVLLYFGLTLIGLDYAIVFAVISALLTLIPYYGAFIGAIPPVLFAIADSPGKGALALVVYIAVQQVESNVTIPLVMSRTVSLHPAVIAIGVLVVGNLMGFAGLFVAVPVLSFIAISTEEFWIKPMEDADRARARSELALPPDAEETPAGSPAKEPFALEEVAES